MLTRPIFDLGNFERLLKRIESARLPIVAGLFPFESARNAEFMANEVPGVRVPEGLMDRMRRADGAEAERAEGIAIARAIARARRPPNPRVVAVDTFRAAFERFYGRHGTR